MADDFDILDASGNTITIGATDHSSVFYTQHVIVDATGNIHPSGDATARPVFVKITNGTIDLGIYAEDAAHSSGHIGIMPLGVRNDTHTTAFSGSDGDYTPLGLDSSGKLGIRGTYAEDAAHSSGDLGISVLAVRSDTAAATGGTDGDWCNLIVDSTGKLHVNVGAFTPGTAAASLGKAEDAAHTSGDVGVMALTVRKDTAAATSGTADDYQPLVTDANGRLHVACGAPVANGASAHVSLNLAATPAAIKAAAGTLYAISVTNTHSAVQYVQVFNIASGSVTPGTSTPTLVVAVPATSTVSVPLGIGLPFSTAISAVATTTATGGSGAQASTMHVTAAYA